MNEFLDTDNRVQVHCTFDSKTNDFCSIVMLLPLSLSLYLYCFSQKKHQCSLLFINWEISCHEQCASILAHAPCIPQHRKRREAAADWTIKSRNEIKRNQGMFGTVFTQFWCHCVYILSSEAYQYMIQELSLRD